MASRKRKASSKGIRQQGETQLAIGTLVVDSSQQLVWFAHDFVLSLKSGRREFGRRVETLIELSRQRRKSDYTNKEAETEFTRV